MNTLQILRPLVFLVPSAILIGLGLWSATMNTSNYLEGMNVITNSKAICDGKRCYCTNARCVTGDDLTSDYTTYFEWSIGLLALGGIILTVSRKWWK